MNKDRLLQTGVTTALVFCAACTREQQIIEITSPTQPPTPQTPSSESFENTYVNVPAVDWKAEYFNNLGLRETPAFSQTEEVLHHIWGEGSPPNVNEDYFSARWHTTVTLTQTGKCIVFIPVDGGARVILDENSMIINEWSHQTGIIRSNSYLLEKGNHSVEVQYASWTGKAQIGPFQLKCLLEKE